jgi:putative endonuclease
MTTSKLDEGRYGEEYAASFLRRKGYKIIDRNFRIRGGEIDLIAIEPASSAGPKTLVFIEVKTRTTNNFGTPFEAIGYYKIKTLLKAAQIYKMKHPGLPDLMRIDAVGVVVDNNSQLLKIDLVKSIT